MRRYRLEETVKMLIHQHFDIWLYKSPEYIVFFKYFLLSLSVIFASTDFYLVYMFHNKDIFRQLDLDKLKFVVKHA